MQHLRSALQQVIRSTSALLVALGVSISLAPTAAAQSGTVTFAGETPQNNAQPVASFSGPVLSFSTQVRKGFGNTAALTDGGLWWTNDYSGQGMMYGFSETRGDVLEVTLGVGAGFSLSLTEALFGSWPNVARHVTYQLFNADFSQTTGPFTVLAGALTPASALFGANQWGSIVRLQFMETDAQGAPAGRGPFDVGVQGIQYTVRDLSDPTVVPEPSTYVLLATGMGMLVIVSRRRRSVLAQQD